MTLMTTADLLWPVSYRWHIQTAWGAYTTVLSVDVPELHGQLEKSRQLGSLLYMSAVADATVQSVRPFIQETVCWQVGEFPAVTIPQIPQGQRFGAAAPRDNTACLVMHTGHSDGRARRRWFLGGMPADWAENGLLTLEGAENLQELGRGMVAGLVAGSGALPMRWIIAYPQAVPVAGPIGTTVGFRYVQSLRVCQYTERVPELSQELWPSAD
jgi:hypothetical protein